MKRIRSLVMQAALLVFFGSGAVAQSNYLPDSTGFVNFNLGTTTIKHDNCHQITLYGCNTMLNVEAVPGGFKWNKANQVVSGIPFGQQVDANGDSFNVSKYYIASPPVFKTNSVGVIDTNVRYDIGLVIPDAFTLNGKKPVQLVYLDYAVLQPMYIKYIEVKFDPSFEKLDKDIVPFKVECNDFPWIATKQIPDGKGATGIGAFIRDSTNSGRLFLPYFYVKNIGKKNTNDSTKQYLDCRVTILNDILFHYEVFFVINGVRSQSINLKDCQNAKISFHCEYRKELPCGCTAAKPIDPYR